MAAFEPMSGVNARVLAVAITPVLTTDIVTYTGTPTAWLEHTGWSIDDGSDGAKIYTSNSPADAEGNIGPRLLRGSLLNCKISLEGVYNGGTVVTDTRFKKGSYVKMNILFHGGSGLGYYSVPCKVISSKKGAKIGPNAISVNVELEVDGLLPDPSTS